MALCKGTIDSMNRQQLVKENKLCETRLKLVSPCHNISKLDEQYVDHVNWRKFNKSFNLPSIKKAT